MKKILLLIVFGFGFNLTWNDYLSLPQLSIGHKILAQFGQYQTVTTQDDPHIINDISYSTTSGCTGVICYNQEWRPATSGPSCVDVLWATDCVCDVSRDPHPDVELARDDSGCPADSNEKDDYGNCTNVQSCPAFYHWDEYSCQCTCSGGYRAYVRDCDGDGYFNPDVDPRAFCFGTEDPGWIELDLAFGEDCSDTCDPWDNSDQIRGPKRYVRDMDGDGYYDSSIGIIERCNDNNGYYILYADSRGKEDCDDTNEDIGAKQNAVYDGDGDGWYDDSKGVQNRCLGDSWIAQSEALGIDCDDTWSEIRGEDIHVYDGDSDGYHDANVPAETRCINNTDDWILEDNSSGVDCNDENASINVEIFYYKDKDCDGLGDPDDKKAFCPGEQDAGYVTNTSDDDDSPLWKRDVDGDLYTQTEERSGCKPGDDWIKSHRSLGDDCDDSKAWLNEIHLWYLDRDGDGYYVDTQYSCASPGAGWSRYSDVGIDLNDNNVFVNEGSCVGDFIIPSLIKEAPDPVTGEMNGQYVTIQGETFRKSDISISYRGVEFQFDDILYDGVSPELRLQPDKLLVRSTKAIIGATINISENTSDPAYAQARSSGSSTDPGTSQWMQERKNERSGYSHATGAIHVEGNSAMNFYENDFQRSHVTQILTEAAGKLTRAGLTVEVKVYEDEGVGANEKGPISTQHKFTEVHGTGTPHVSMSLRKKLDGTIEYVVSIDDSVFTPNVDALTEKGWTQSSELDGALTQVSLNRLININSLAHRYPDYTFETVPSPTAPEQRFDMPAEDYPGYEAGDLSLFESILEYVSYSKILITDLKVPKGSYDSYNEPAEYNDWKVHNIGTIAGSFDTGLEEVRDLVELTRLAESIFDEKFWNQVLESLKNFNLADFAQSQLNQLEEYRNDLLGDNGRPMQYYRGAYTVIKTIKTAITIYKSLGKEFLDTFNPDCSHPDFRNNVVTNVDHQLNDILPDRLHRSDAFSDLNKVKKDKLIEDIASTDDNLLAKELANKPELIDSWKALDDAGIDAALKTDPSWLNRVNRWSNDGLEVANDGRILQNGNDVGRIVNNNLEVNHSGFGGKVIANPEKTTTIVGKWQDQVNGGGTSEIINSKLSVSGQNKGGINALNEDLPDGWTEQQIWDNVNEPWLRDAANRGDVIRVVSDPTVATNIYKPDGSLSFFGREHEMLTKPVSQGGLGYTYDPSTFTYTK